MVGRAQGPDVYEKDYCRKRVAKRKRRKRMGGSHVREKALEVGKGGGGLESWY